MRIAQIAPLHESAPPALYGGTERVVSYLTEALVELGHDVTLFASGDSHTAAQLEAVWPMALRRDPTIRDKIAPHFLLLEAARRRAHEFDIMHFHLDYAAFPLFSRQSTPYLATLHGRLDWPELQTVFNAFAALPVVSISNAQRRPLPHLNWRATVQHGLPQQVLLPRADITPSYLAFLGRIAPEKRVDLAIRIAQRSGMRLRIAAKIDDADRDYYETEIRPLMSLPHVDFIGEISDAQKPAFLSGAHALLFPLDWAEPFGLVMIEAMACGTPVIAFRRGSVPEVIDEGVSGFIVDDEEGAVTAVSRLGDLSRVAVRACFESRFTSRHMALRYLAVYDALITAQAAP